MLNYSNCTQTNSELASSLPFAFSVSSAVKASPSATEEWIFGSGIAPALTTKWLGEIEDPDEIAELLNWKF